MPTRPISDVEPGDILTQPVIDRMGNQLVASGVEVTAALLTVLRRRGIIEVVVAGVEDLDDAAAEEASYSPDSDSTSYKEETSSSNTDLVMAQLINDMRERLVIGFERHVEDVPMAVLYQTATDYLTRKIHAQVQGGGA